MSDYISLTEQDEIVQNLLVKGKNFGELGTYLGKIPNDGRPCYVFESNHTDKFLRAEEVIKKLHL